MKTVAQRIRNIRIIKKKSYPTFLMVRKRYVETINAELKLLRSLYREADQATKDKYKNKAIELKTILKELE